MKISKTTTMDSAADVSARANRGLKMARIRSSNGTPLTKCQITGWIILALLVAGCSSQPQRETVLVTFEIQLINAQANSYTYGVVGGQGTTGFGTVNETIRESYYADVGDEVFAWVNGSQWSSQEPGHQVICRILVGDEEIYLDANQGTPSQDTQAQCRGPLYIPPTPTPGGG